MVIALASLQHGESFSIFFELASCNLWQYLSGDYACGISNPCQDNIRPPSTLEEKGDIFCRGLALAGALDFLHTQFKSLEFQNFACYHLDLKPHNILVFDAYQPTEQWKITDFGLSRVKGWSINGDFATGMPFVGRTQRVRSAGDPSTINRRGEGTYLAPEGVVADGAALWKRFYTAPFLFAYLAVSYSNRKNSYTSNEDFISFLSISQYVKVNKQS